MAEDITLEVKLRRFDAALDKLQRMVEADNVVPEEVFSEFLMAAENYRSDIRYKALSGPANNNSDSNAA
jgi:hypothetical protein